MHHEGKPTMISEILVRDHQTLAMLLHANGHDLPTGTVAVVITDTDGRREMPSELEALRFQKRTVGDDDTLFLAFDDENPCDNYAVPDDLSPMSEMQAMLLSCFVRATAERRDVSTLSVSCAGGVSRSASIALAAKDTATNDHDQKLFAHNLEISFQHVPIENTWVRALAFQALSAPSAEQMEPKDGDQE